MPLLDVKRYDFIDALRGWAILGVILVHSSRTVVPNSATLLWWMNEGARGVQLFFVISALTLCMSWAARSADEPSPIRNFYIRRFFRIAPLFYIFILIYLALNGVAPSYWSPNGIEWWFAPATAAFLHGFHPETINSVVPGGWSIAVEMSFYAIFPLLVRVIKSLKSCLVFLMISLLLYGLNGLLAPHLFAYPESQQYLVQSFAMFNFFGQLPVFIMGIGCYLIFRQSYPRKQIAIVGGALFAMLLLLFCYPIAGLPHHLIAGALFAVATLLLAHWPVGVLVNRVTTTFGKLSFGMYLTHFVVLTYFSRLGVNDLFQKSNLDSVLYFGCVVLAAAVASWILHKTIENPGIALGKRIIEKLEENSAK